MMLRMWRHRSSLLLGLVALVLLSAVSFAQAQEKVKVTFWTWLSNEAMVEEFNRLHPNIQVEHVKMGAYDAQNKFLVALSSGTGAPDVIQLMARHFSLFSTTGKLVDVTDKVRDIKDGYPANLLEAVSYNSRMYGLPADVSPAVLWYRRDIFKKYGIEVPFATWDDFEKAAETLKRNGVTMMPLFYPAGSWGANALVMYLHSRGGNIYTPDGKVIRNNKELEYTLQWLYDLHKGGLAEGITFFTPEFWGAFKAGEFACWPMNVAEGANIRQYMPELSGNWGVMPFPRWSDKKEQTTGIWGGTVLAVPKQSKVRDAALTFVKWVAGTAQGQVWASKTWNAVPAYSPAYKDSFYALGDPYYGGDNVYRMINPVKPFYYFDWAITERIIGKQLDLMFAGKATPAAARAAIEAELIDETNR